METNNDEVLEKDEIKNEDIENEVAQNTVLQNEMSEPDGEQNQNGKTKINLKILVGLLVAVVLICFVCVFVGVLLKNDEEKFFDFLIEKQAFINFVSETTEKAKNSNQVDTALEIDIAEIANKIGGNFEDDLKFGLNLSNLKLEDDISGSLELVLNDKSAGFVHYAKTGELYGAKLDETTDKFLALENKNLKDTFRAFEVENIETIPDKVLTAKDFRDAMKIDRKTFQKILDKYIKVLAKSAKGKVYVEKNVELDIDGQKMKTTKYSLVIKEKDALEMELAFVKALKNDRKTLMLFVENYKAIIELLEKNGYDVQEMYNDLSDKISDTSKACDEIQKALEETYVEIKEELEEVEAGGEAITINVYENKNETIATEIAAGDSAIVLKCFVDNNAFIALSLVTDGSEYGSIILEGENATDSLQLNVKLKIQGISIDLFTLRQEYKKKADKDILKLDNQLALIINEASKEEIEAFEKEFQTGLTDWTTDLLKKFPEISDMISSSQQDSYDDYYYNDYDYSEYYSNYN